MAEFGKALIFLGVILIALGVLLTVSDKIPWMGRLPGDIVIKREHVTFYAPITTGIILSIILSVGFFLLGRW